MLMSSSSHSTAKASKPFKPSAEQLAFLEALHHATLPPQQFTHRDHLHYAWLLLRLHSFEIACARCLAGIWYYANHLGAHDKFHFTLTRASLFLVAQRQQQCMADDFEQFLAANSDLLSQFSELIAQHYSPQQLANPAAKSGWLAPDRLPLPLLPHNE